MGFSFHIVSSCLGFSLIGLNPILNFKLEQQGHDYLALAVSSETEQTSWPDCLLCT